MYRPGGDTPQFQPVPAAPPPVRMMPPPFITPPPMPPPGHAHVHAPMQGRPPVMQQYMYLPPAPSPQPPPPLLAPPPASLRGPPASMHPSMQPNLPSMQRPSPMMQPNMASSLPAVHPSRSLLQPPPPPMQESFPSMRPLLPSVRPVSTPFQPPLMQVQPPSSFVPTPFPPIQPPPFLPPLPPSPPSENPPPPPPPSPPPLPASLPVIESSSSSSVAGLLPPEPPKPTDPEMLKNIDVLAAFVAKNGPRFESMARARQAGDPKFAFLFESDASPEAAIGHEFYKWKKLSCALKLGLESENKKNNRVDLGTASGHILHLNTTPGQPLLHDDFPASPAMSDMDMEDDFIPIPAKEPMDHLESANLDVKESDMTQKNPQVSAIGCINDMPTMQDLDGSSKQVFQEGTLQGKDFLYDTSEAFIASLNGKNMETMDGSSRNEVSNLPYVDEHRQVDGPSALTKDGDGERVLELTESFQRLPDLTGRNSGLEPQVKLEITDVSQGAIMKHPEQRMGRLSRWGSMPKQHSNKSVEDRGDTGKPNALPDIQDRGWQTVEESTSPRQDSAFNDFVGRAIDMDKSGEENSGNCRPPDRESLQPKQEAVTVDAFGRLVQKEAMESESDDDIRPWKRRRSYSRSRSRSRSRGRGRSRSRSRSRSASYSSGESRWRRQNFSRSPRRKRLSRSCSHSPRRWQHNASKSPSTDMRWGGMARSDRDWRGERESYGRGRRGGRGSGPSICFHFARGRCFRGSACKFLHPEKEIGQERRMLSKDGFADVEPGQTALITHKLMTDADPHMDPLHGSKEEFETGSTEDIFLKDATSQIDGARSLIGGFASIREASRASHNSALAANVVGTQPLSEAARYVAKPPSIMPTESVKSSAVDAGVDTDTVGVVGVVGKVDASKETDLDEIAAEYDNREIRSKVEDLELLESLKVVKSTRKEVDEKLDPRGESVFGEKLADGVSQIIQGSELEGDTKNIRVRHKDPNEGANSPKEPPEMVSYEKMSPMISRGKSNSLSDQEVPKKPVAMSSKLELVSESKMLKSEDVTGRGFAELATARSDVDQEACGGSEVSKACVSGSSSPVPFPQASLMGKSEYMPCALMNQDSPSEQMHGSVLGHRSGQRASPAAKRMSPQVQPHSSPMLCDFTNTSNSFSVGNFIPSHLILSQVTSSLSANTGAHHPVSINRGQHVSILSETVQGTLRSQLGHRASFPSHLGFSQNTSQQSLLLPQDHLPNLITNQPGQFSSNPSMLQGLGIQPFPAKEPQEWSVSFSSLKEVSTDAHYNDRQYRHSNPSSDILQHAYLRSGINASTALVNTPLPWKGDSLAASRPTLVSSAEKPHYSYTLTTIPPLPDLIKLPGGTSLLGSGEQYDPLSDVLDLGSSGALKSLSSKPLGDRRPVGVGFLESVSPGLDSEKANISAPKLEVDDVNTNEAAADVGVVENVSPPGDWSPVQPGDAVVVGHDQLHSKSKKSSRGLKLLRTAVADRVKALLKPSWKEGRLSKDAFKTIAKKAVEKVTGNLPSHHIPKSQEKVDQFMTVSSSKISKLVQGYVDKYSKV